MSEGNGVVRSGYGVNVSKEQKFGWTIDGRQADSFSYIQLNMLNIDEVNYQRHSYYGAVLAIAKNWCWIACGCLIVARRQDGTLWIMEGAHRFRAAKHRTDIEALPCMVWDVENLQEEARMFLLINEHRKTVNSLAKFKAGTTAEDASCLAVAKLVEKYGYSVGSHSIGKSVGCTQLLRKMIVDDPVLCEQVFSLCCKMAKGGQIMTSVIGGIKCLEMALRRRNDGQSLFDTHNTEKLVAIGMEALNAKCIQAVAFFGKGGELTFARGILRAINENRKTRRINEDI